MAKMTFRAGDEYAMKLSKLAKQSDEVARKAIYAGAKIVADEIKRNIQSLPEEKYRHLKSGEQFSGVPKQQKNDLIKSFGISPISVDNLGNWNAKVGFDGYGSTPTKKYPNGLPNQLLARSVESGSSVRKKKPFVRPAVNAKRKIAQSEMERIINEEIMKIMK